MYGICQRCYGTFPVVRGIYGDRTTILMAGHDDERGRECSGSGEEPFSWPVQKPYRPEADDSGGFGGGLSDF